MATPKRAYLAPEGDITKELYAARGPRVKARERRPHDSRRDGGAAKTYGVRKHSRERLSDHLLHVDDNREQLPVGEGQGLNQGEVAGLFGLGDQPFQVVRFVARRLK